MADRIEIGAGLVAEKSTESCWWLTRDEAVIGTINAGRFVGRAPSELEAIAAFIRSLDGKKGGR